MASGNRICFSLRPLSAISNFFPQWCNDGNSSLLAANFVPPAKCFRWALSLLAEPPTLPTLPPFEADFGDNVKNLGSPSQRGSRRVRSCESTRVWSSVRGGFLGQVGVGVSLGSVGNLFQSSLQLTRRPNEPGQGLLLWASPAKPSKAVRAITQTLQPT